MPFSSGLTGSLDGDGASIAGGGATRMQDGAPNQGMLADEEFRMLEAEHHSTNKAKEHAEMVMQYTALVVAAA